jgi:hypothetical protein
LNYINASGPTFTISGLQGGVEYSVRVIAVNSVGESIPSNPYYATPYMLTYNTAPEAPTIEYVQDENGYSIVYYSLGMDNGSAIQAIYYTISEYTGRPINLPITSGQTPVSGEPVNGKIPVYLSFVLNNLVNGVVYVIRMYATNQYGLSIASDIAYVAPYTSPSAPIVTRTFARNNTALIEYTVNDDGGRNITDVFYSVNGQPYVSNGTNNSIYLTQLLNNNIYTLRLVAKNQAGLVSPVSIESSFEPYYFESELAYIKQTNTANQSLSKRQQYALTVRINKGKRRYIG